MQRERKRIFSSLFTRMLGLLTVIIFQLQAGTSHADPATELRLIKFRDYVQTSDSAPTTPGETGFFAALITADPAQLTSWTLSVNGTADPDGGSDFGYDGVAGTDNFLEYFDDYSWANVAALETNYPNGANYCFEISGGTAGLLTQCEVGLGTVNWGNIPYLTGTKFTELNTWDVTQDFTVTIPTPAGTVSHVEVEVYTDDVDETTVFSNSDFGPAFDTSVVIPGGTLIHGVDYGLFIEFANATGMGTGDISPTGPNAKGHNIGTDMVFTPTGPPTTELRLLKFKDYVQDSNSQPNAASPDIVGFFALLLASDTSQFTTWDLTVTEAAPVGGDELGYEGDPSLETYIEFFADYDYVDENTQADLDADYPNGAEYCFNISGGDAGTLQQCETGLGTESYPNVPYLTGTQFDDLNDIDVTQPHTFTINTPNGDVTHVFLEIYTDDANEDQVWTNSDFGDPSFDTTIEMPADTLEEGVPYGLFIEFAGAQPAGTGPISPNGGPKGYNVATDMVFMVPEPSAALSQLAGLVSLLGLAWRKRVQR